MVENTHLTMHSVSALATGAAVGLGLGRCNYPVDAAVFTTTVRVDRPVEADVRAGVAADDGLGPLGRDMGPQRRGRRVVGGPTVVERFTYLALEATRLIRLCAAPTWHMRTVRRNHRHAPT